MRWALIALATLLVLAGALLAAVPYLVDLPRAQVLIADSATRALGRPVRFSSLSLAVLPLPSVVVADLAVAEDPRFGSEPFVVVPNARFRLRVFPLLVGRVEFADLTLNAAHLRLIEDASGRWNVMSLGAVAGNAAGPPSDGALREGGEATLPVVSRLHIVDGTMSYELSARKGPATSYRAEGMDVTLGGLGRGAPVTVRGRARVNPGDVAVDLDGTVGPPLVGSLLSAAAVKGDVTFAATEMAPLSSLFLGRWPGLSGPLKGTLSVSGTLGRPVLAGVLESARPTLTRQSPGCPPPRPRRLALGPVRFPLAYDPTQLSSRSLSATLGLGRVTLALELAWEPAPLLSLQEIRAEALPLAPILVDYLCNGYAVSGPLDLTGALSARPGNVLGTMAGQGQLRIGAGRVMGPAALALLGGVVQVAGALSSVLNVELPMSIFSSPLEFRSITASFQIADGRVSTRDFRYTSERMTIAAAGEYRLTDGRMNVALLMTHGRGEIRAKVTGLAASPSIRALPTSILGTEPARIPGHLKRLFERMTR
jgi:hypothetical protein